MGIGIRVLVMGLPGSGKSTLSDALHKTIVDSIWLNADKIRALHEDWDFSHEGRMRQAARMRLYANVSDDDVVIADFVCPLPEMRAVYEPDIVVWMDTIKSGRFEDTNKAFVPPEKYDFRVIDYDTNKWVNLIVNQIKRFRHDATLPKLERDSP